MGPGTESAQTDGARTPEPATGTMLRWPGGGAEGGEQTDIAHIAAAFLDMPVNKVRYMDIMSSEVTREGQGIPDGRIS
jgi:hypothetical protein